MEGGSRKGKWEEGRKEMVTMWGHGSSSVVLAVSQ